VEVPQQHQLQPAICFYRHKLPLQGLVQAVGVSNYGPQQLQRIHRQGAALEGLDIPQSGLVLADAHRAAIHTTVVLCIRYLQQQGVPLSSAQVMVFCHLAICLLAVAPLHSA
jgi:aryl-alcohol dehydrogenase-like predicted oxidoreductase